MNEKELRAGEINQSIQLGKHLTPPLPDTHPSVSDLPDTHLDKQGWDENKFIDDCLKGRFGEKINAPELQQYIHTLLQEANYKGYLEGQEEMEKKMLPQIAQAKEEGRREGQLDPRSKAVMRAQEEARLAMLTEILGWCDNRSDSLPDNIELNGEMVVRVDDVIDFVRSLKTNSPHHGAE